MDAKHPPADDFWTAFRRARRRITWSQIGANLAGAFIVTPCFVFFQTKPTGDSAVPSFTLPAVDINTT